MLTGESTTIRPSRSEESLRWDLGTAPSWAFIAPFTFRAQQGAPAEIGAVTAYFDEQPSDVAIRLVREAADAFPVIYASVADRPALTAVDLVSDLLRRLDRQPRHASVAQVQEVLDAICTGLAKHLRCHEAVVHLNRAPKGTNPKWVRGSTVPDPFEPVPGSGPLGWVLSHGKPVWLPNARRAGEQFDIIEARYPGSLKDFDLSMLTEIDPGLEEELSLRQHRADPILSWLAAPIIVDATVCGVVRCGLAIDEPSHFSQRELRPVQLVAELLAHFWQTWLQSARLNDTIEEVLRLNATAHRALAPCVPAEDHKLRELVKSDDGLRLLLDEALERVETLVPRATITSIRALDATRPTDRWLDIVASRGAAWAEGTPAAVATRRSHRFAVDRDDDPSLGRLVVRQRAALQVEDVSRPGEGLACHLLFPETTHSILCVPIMLGTQVLGVLDLRSRADPFTDQEVQAAESVAAQLGFYFGLAEAFHRQQERVLAEQKMVEDLVHQLSSPLRAAGGVLDRLSADVRAFSDGNGRNTSSIERSAWIASRLAARAARTAESARLFRELAVEPNVVTVNPRAISTSHVATMMRQAVEDAKLLTPRSRNLKFELRDKAIASCGACWFDEGHLEQCLTQLLDNARKYAYPFSTVVTEAARVDGWAVRLTVISTGTPLARTDVGQCVERGWRGTDARFVTADGHGIGLIVVDRVMSANGGRLDINPSGDLMRVELCLPKGPSSV